MRVSNWHINKTIYGHTIAVCGCRKPKHVQSCDITSHRIQGVAHLTPAKHSSERITQDDFEALQRNGKEVRLILEKIHLRGIDYSISTTIIVDCSGCA